MTTASYFHAPQALLFALTTCAHAKSQILVSMTTMRPAEVALTAETLQKTVHGARLYVITGYAYAYTWTQQHHQTSPALASKIKTTNVPTGTTAQESDVLRELPNVLTGNVECWWSHAIVLATFVTSTLFTYIALPLLRNNRQLLCHRNRENVLIKGADFLTHPLSTYTSFVRNCIFSLLFCPLTLFFLL